MPIRLYNTLTKTKEDFAPIDPANVRMYVCGPTVYDFAHIGNARPAIVFDLLYRLLRHEYGAAHVTYVRNITDVDDKINERALRDFPGLPLNQAIRNVTEKTEAQYHADVAALGCLPPTHEPRATQHITGMQALIEQLLARGHAYQAAGEVLFDTQSMPDYGKLSGRKLDEQQAGARIAVDAHKKHPHDFVLWKQSADNEPGWESPWGRGRPGWHIECSAMSAHHLGNVFDIHGGGLDLIFPHHENEIAQSRCAHGTKVMANVWMHNGFLQVEGEKMSKSLGNFLTIRELLDKFPGGALRYSMLQTHYRQPINWTHDRAEESWSELRDWVGMLYGSRAEHDMHMRKVQKVAPKPHPSVLEALCDDLNTSDAVAALRALYKNRDDLAYSYLIESCEFLGFFDSEIVGAYFRGVSGENLGHERTFAVHGLVQNLKVAYINRDKAKIAHFSEELLSQGIDTEIRKDGDVHLKPVQGEVVAVFDDVQRAIEARNAARAAKNFAESDRIRDELLAKGIVLKDGPQGTTWEVKR